NILLRIIPTTSREKEAFTYYRDASDASIVDSRVLSRTLHLWVRSPPIEGIGEEVLLPEINTRKLCYKLSLFLIRIRTNKNGLDNKHPSCSFFAYLYNHRRLMK
ncbi:hypothetical protein DVH24_042030, partial [Malus domestica]